MTCENRSKITLSRRMVGCVVGTAAFLLVSGGILGYRLARASGAPATQPLSYTGTIEESGVLVTGTRDFMIRVWSDVASTESKFVVCTTVAAGVPVSSGRFRVPLDDSCTAAIHQNPELWIDIIVGSTSLGRRKIGAVPYALEAQNAAHADTASSATGALASQLAPLASMVDLASVQTITGAKTFAAQIVANGGVSATGGVNATGQVAAYGYSLVQYGNVRAVFTKTNANAVCPSGSAASYVPWAWQGKTGNEICAGDFNGAKTCTGVKFVYVTAANSSGAHSADDRDCSQPVPSPWPWGEDLDRPDTLDGEWAHGNTRVVCCR